MSAPAVVIANVSCEGLPQRSLSKDDHVIQALAANRTNEPFDVGPMPRRSRRGKYLFDAHDLHLLDEVLPEDSITIAQ